MKDLMRLKVILYVAVALIFAISLASSCTPAKVIGKMKVDSCPSFAKKSQRNLTF